MQNNFIAKLISCLPEGIEFNELIKFSPSGLWKDNPYLAAISALRKIGKFDTDDYYKRYPDIWLKKIDAIEHFVYHGINEDRYFNIKYLNNKNIDIIIIFNSTIEELEKCLISLGKNNIENCKVVVLTRGLNEQTKNSLITTVGNNHFFEYIEYDYCNNEIELLNEYLKTSNSKYKLILRSNIEISNNLAQELLRELLADYMNGMSGIAFKKTDNEKNNPINVSSVDCGAFMIKQRLIDSIGLLDEKNFKSFEASHLDFCYRLKNKGFKIRAVKNLLLKNQENKFKNEKNDIEIKINEINSLRKKYKLDDYCDKTFYRNNLISRLIPVDEIDENERIEESVDEKIKVEVIPSSEKIKTIYATGYVRLILPYTNEYVKRFCDVSIKQKFNLPNNSKVVVLQRHEAGFKYNEIVDFMENYKSGGGKIIYDIDDDLLDINALKERGSKGDIKKEIIEPVTYMLKNADLVHVSTDTLYELVSNYNPRVKIIKNTLDKDIWRLDINNRDGIVKNNSENKLIRIGYLGSPTHDEDLNIIADAMNEINKKYKGKISIEIIGASPHKKPAFGQFIKLPEHKGYPAFVKLLHKYATWDIGILPLVDSKFNRCKSNQKFLEYSALGLSIIVSDVYTYRDITIDGYNCLKAKNITKDWIDKLSALIENPHLRNKLAINAFTQCALNYTLINVASSLVDSVKLLTE